MPFTSLCFTEDFATVKFNLKSTSTHLWRPSDPLVTHTVRRTIVREVLCAYWLYNFWVAKIFPLLRLVEDKNVFCHHKYDLSFKRKYVDEIRGSPLAKRNIRKQYCREASRPQKYVTSNVKYNFIFRLFICKIKGEVNRRLLQNARMGNVKQRTTSTRLVSRNVQFFLPVWQKGSSPQTRLVHPGNKRFRKSFDIHDLKLDMRARKSQYTPALKRHQQ